MQLLHLSPSPPPSLLHCWRWEVVWGRGQGGPGWRRCGDADASYTQKEKNRIGSSHFSHSLSHSLLTHPYILNLGSVSDPRCVSLFQTFWVNLTQKVHWIAWNWVNFTNWSAFIFMDKTRTQESSVNPTQLTHCRTLWVNLTTRSAFISSVDEPKTRK